MIMSGMVACAQNPDYYRDAKICERWVQRGIWYHPDTKPFGSHQDGPSRVVSCHAWTWISKEDVLIVVTGPEDGIEHIDSPRQYTDPKKAHEYAINAPEIRAKELRLTYIQSKKENAFYNKRYEICPTSKYYVDFGASTGDKDGNETTHFHCIGTGKPDRTTTMTMDKDGRIYVGKIVESGPRTAFELGEEKFTPVPHSSPRTQHR